MGVMSALARTLILREYPTVHDDGAPALGLLTAPVYSKLFIRELQKKTCTTTKSAPARWMIVVHRRDPQKRPGVTAWKLQGLKSENKPRKLFAQ